MNERQRAIDILKRSREILAERLTERILDAHEDILNDVLGLSYTSEIEAIYEQFGPRLSHLNSLIKNMPPLNESAVGPAVGPCQAPSGAPAEPSPTSRRPPLNPLALPAPQTAGLQIFLLVDGRQEAANSRTRQ